MTPGSLSPAERPAVVTGASSGIGEATARLLATTGHPVVLGARRVDRCQKVADEINAGGGTAHAFPLDLADLDSVAAFAKRAQELAGDIDVLVSNAGANGLARAMTSDLSLFSTQLQVNVIGTQALVQAIGAGMVARGRGQLVFVTSELVHTPRPGVAAYVTSKWALEGLVNALRMELEGTGLRVSSVRPGQTITEMGFDWDAAETDQLLRDWQHWGFARHSRFMSPKGVAAAVGAVVGTPQNVCLTVVDVEPVAPADPSEPPGEHP